MALYSCSIKNIKRGQGASSVAKAAYNSRSRLEDTRTDNLYDYSRKQDLGFSEIIAPENAPAWVKDRQQLWAKTELANKRRDARTAKEILVALPRELDINEQLSLVRKFVAKNLTPLGVIADVNAHELDPSILPKQERENWNPHCHILINTQHLADGEFGQKITQLNNRSFVLDLRESWADLVNERLEAIGSSDRVDHRSNRARGIDRLPQIHLGHRVCSLKKKGIATDRGARYQEIEQRNQEIKTITLSVSEAIRIARLKKQQAAELAHQRKKALLQLTPTQPAISTDKTQNHPDITQEHHRPSHQPNQPRYISGLDVVKNSLPEQMKAMIADKQQQKQKSPKPWWQKATDFVLGREDSVKPSPKNQASQVQPTSPLERLAQNSTRQSSQKQRVESNSRRVHQPQPQTKEQIRELASALIEQINNWREVNQQLRTTMARLAVSVEPDRIRILARDIKGNISQQSKLTLIRGSSGSGWQLTRYELRNYQRRKLLQVLKQVEQTKSKIKAQATKASAQRQSKKQESPSSTKNDRSMSRYLHSPSDNQQNKPTPKPNKPRSKGFEL
ncbi:MAG: MobQ family relaxase [Cyanobacteria bacterium P01_C01_bin.72]